jgi:phytoene dehydrogenase-like protein
MHYLVPESGLLVNFASGSNATPCECALLGEPPAADGSVVYERVHVQHESEPFEFKLWQRHLPDLYKRFPEHRAEIDAWLAAAREAVEAIPRFVLSKLLPFRWQKRLAPLLLRTFRKHAGRTSEDVLKEITKNPRLASVLGSLWLDTGSPPHEATFMLSAAVVYGLPTKGGAYPTGGSAAMAAPLVAAIERTGGRVLVRADVAEILVSGSPAVPETLRAAGVRLTNDHQILAPLVVSSAGFHNTFAKLLAPEVTRALRMPTELPGVPPSAGFVMVTHNARVSILPMMRPRRGAVAHTERFSSVLWRACGVRLIWVCAAQLRTLASAA